MEKIISEIKKDIQQTVNETAEFIKGIDQKLIGGDSCIFFYDKYDNFLFCFRQENKTRQELLNNFVKFYEYETTKGNIFDLKNMLKNSYKLEFITKEV